ncbi:MAG: 1-acyl-sn-glycerol-3-phosphate acyltransferase [Treponema sp.]|nr:1-acyl-sn-glycerol-3-phosphate acyltransferase [Treponema sp.]
MSEKNPERLKVIARIEEYEKKGWWSKDVEDDPPTIPLTPDKVDYLNKKFSNKIATFFVNIGAKRFIKNLVKKGQMVIKDVRGIENYEAIQNSGAILTCNHFNAFDNFAIHYALFPYMYRFNGKVLYKVIREGNFTNFPGLYGFFFRHCNTLPLSANFSTMKKFMEAMKVLLTRGEKVLVYAEQGMWWNYRKPRPLTPGAFKFAVESKVPVLPVFITMEDSDKIDGDGFPVQEYTVHFLPAIFPDETKSSKENIEEMKQKNYEAWKAVYEDFYKIPLTYSTLSDAEQQ